MLFQLFKWRHFAFVESIKWRLYDNYKWGVDFIRKSSIYEDEIVDIFEEISHNFDSSDLAYAAKANRVWYNLTFWALKKRAKS